MSASKVRRAQQMALASRAYAEAALRILEHIAEGRDGGMKHPLLDEHSSVKSVEVVLISSDRGLAGPYNTNIINTALNFRRKMKDIPVQFVTVGRKGRDAMIRRGVTVIAEFSNLPAWPTIQDIRSITRTAVDDFLNGVVDEVYIVYTVYINTLVQEPRILRLLPLNPQAGIGQAQTTTISSRGPHAVYTFEPDPEAILDEIMPRFTELQFYQAMLESLASEHSARMIAMRNATENANSAIEQLTLSYNNARQAAITREILDIVGGAEALG
jgi:F-type H+-transporting ATPase subunit gamma